MNWQYLLEADVLVELGKKLQQYRKHLGLSQQQLADKIGISRYRISNIERGENFTMEVFIRLLKTYNKLNDMQQLFEISSISPKELFQKSQDKK